MPSTPQPQRTWGTRYDSLVDTPPSTSTTSSPEFVLHRGGPAEKDRPLISVPVPAAIENATHAHVQTRMPHDASVFVASLPSQIPENDLLALLTAHLAPHATIKHIKLIRDNRGAVCAFVQVESAHQAAALISACNLSIFMDRQIRCEHARAFRTLIVSWRAPGDDVDKEMAAVRLRRCRGSRYIQVTHGPDAVQFDATRVPNFSAPRDDDLLSGAGVFFEDGVKEGNYETLKHLMYAFGPLEFIKPCDQAVDLNDSTVNTGNGDASVHNPCAQNDPAIKLNDDGNQKPTERDENGKLEPIHNHNQNALQKQQIYEVKWEHRNDAVSAITALQCIPTLSVCWSHTHGGRPHSNIYENDGRGPTIYGNERGYGGDRSFGNGGDKSFNSYGDRSFGGNEDRSFGGQGDRLFNGHNGDRPFNRYNNPSAEFDRRSPSSVAFSESDFPPLAGHGSGSGIRGGRRRGAWGRKGFVQSSVHSPTLSLDISPLPPTPSLDPQIGVQPSPITSGFPETPDSPAYRSRGPPDNQTESQEKDSRSDISLAPVAQKDAELEVVGNENRSIIIHEDGNGNKALQFQSENVDADADAPLKSIDASAAGNTNDYPAVSPLGTITNNTPRPYNHYSYPNYPPRHQNHQQYPQASQMDEDHPQVFDSHELFVGGLNNKTWTEERVKEVFGAYGTIEALRFMRPGYHAPMHKKAFAFVRFTGVEGPQRAIQDQHLRIYDDHEIKVQLRDANPPRRSQWVYRGRGSRFHQGFGPPGHIHFDQQNEQFEHETSIEAYPDAAKSAQHAAKDTVNVGAIETVPVVEVVSVDSMCNPAHESVTSPVSETQSSPDTTLTESPVNISNTMASPLRRGTQSEPDTQTSSPSYAPSSASAGSAPAGTSYYQQATPSWMPPYTMPTAPYAPYGYYPQQTTPTTQEAGGTYPWMTVYRNVVPVLPWFSPPPGVELAPAPVRPTGYIQRDGIFIPVYPPERLGQYMSSADPSSTSSQTAPTNWQNLPPHPQLYPVPYPMMMPQGQQHQATHQQQHQQPNSNGWIASSPSSLGVVYPPSTAPPPYPAPNAYYPNQSAGVRPSGYVAPYENTSIHQGQGKNGTSNRRGDYNQRIPREGRRRGTGTSMNGTNTGDQAQSGGEVPWMKANVAPVQVATASGAPQWN